MRRKQWSNKFAKKMLGLPQRLRKGRVEAKCLETPEDSSPNVGTCVEDMPVPERSRQVKGVERTDSLSSQSPDDRPWSFDRNS